METIELKLIVPETESERSDILQIVAEYFSTHSVLPPVSQKKLSEYADEIINGSLIDSSFHAFVMVCCGNEIWRQAIENIPFNRRILLLPECLKSTHNCSAEKDTFGVLCAGCNTCSINGILEEAEELGYISLITEGTTITQKLIEEGNIDAVIGVGCMEVLEKMYKSVTKFAIPSIGIPLLYHGCKETAVDKEWLMKEIKNYNPDSNYKTINLNHLHTSTKKLFSTKELQKHLGKPKNKTEEIALEYLQIGGQRLRPLLTRMTYQAFTPEYDEQTSTKLAIAIECFHKASLIHDDIEDEDTERYGEETIHVKYSTAIAINTGDYLLGLGYKLITECNIDPKNIAKCIKTLSEGHLALSIGQGNELFTVFDDELIGTDKMLDIFKNKTAAAFKAALILGTYAAGENEGTVKILSELSTNIGIAYQIKDDLKDYKGADGDILSRNFSIILSILKEESANTSKKILGDIFEKNNKENLFQLIEDRNIVHKTEKLMFSFLDASFKNLEKIPNLSAKLALHEAIGKIFNEYI